MQKENESFLYFSVQVNPFCYKYKYTCTSVQVPLRSHHQDLVRLDGASPPPQKTRPPGTLASVLSIFEKIAAGVHAE